MGGIGAGTICLEGSGALSAFSLENHPDLFDEPCVFAAIRVEGAGARVLEGPVPIWKIFGLPGCATGCEGASYGLPRFEGARFSSRFPFGIVDLEDRKIPLGIKITGWSPFIPGDADNSSLPVAALEYRFSNPTKATVSTVFSFSAKNFLGNPVGIGRDEPGGTIGSVPGGFVLKGVRASLAASVSDPAVKVNHAWYRGSWFAFDPLAIAWKEIAEGNCPERSPIVDGPPAGGGTLFVPFDLAPGEERTIALRRSWYCPGEHAALRTRPRIRPLASRAGQVHLQTPVFRPLCPASRP